GGGDEQLEGGHGVLYLGALVEIGPTDHLVGELVADEDVLEHPAVGVCSGEDPNLVAAHAAPVDQLLPLARDEARRGMLALELGEVDLLALAELGPEALAEPAGVVGDDTVGGLENGLGRAVVLLELDDEGVLEVDRELEDVADLGPAEAVDRLILVADHGEIAVLAAEQLEQPVLGVVRVLVLVD